MILVPGATVISFGANANFVMLRSTIGAGESAVAEIADARVFGGIHFRTACVFGNTLGRAVAEYVMTHAMLEHGEGREDDRR